LLGKNGAFLENLETRFLATTCVSGALQHVLSSILVWQCWVRAVVGSVS
jgi:hypothetical protein